jgi:hypothetical protein
MSFVLFAPLCLGSGTVRFIGLFTNVESHGDGESCSGYNIDLYEYENSIIGRIDYYPGRCFDPSSGMLEKASYEPATGQISFSAKVTTGLYFSKKHKNVPSREYYSFTGILKDSSISGTLKFTNMLDPDLSPADVNISLKKTEQTSLREHRSKEQWDAAMKDILKFRGPKW